jgi:hypothetical protein
MLCLLLTVATALTWTGCKKKSDNNNNVSTSAVALSIQTGAKTISPDQSITYSAVLVDASGNTSTASDVSWSVSNNVGAFTGNIFKPSGSGYGTVTASAVVNGTTLTAKVAVGVYLPAVFTVVPSAIIWSTNAGTIDLTSVYLGTGSVSGYTYSSTNTAVASVDNAGKITFNGIGECLITVTANGINENNKVCVPVTVVGMPSTTLPVVRVEVTPAGVDMFRGETSQLSAKAFNSSNAQASPTFTWASDNTGVATVSASGQVTAVGLGKAVVTATASGIVGQAEINVLPDTTIIVTPIMASLGANGTKQFTAQTYVVNKTNKTLSVINPGPALTWEIPTTGLAMFDIATVSTTGLVTMKSSATVGLSTVVLAHAASPTIEPGAALLTVSDCDCGTTTPGVTSISVTSSTMNISMVGGPQTVNATALDASNNPVTTAAIHLCSDNPTVCSVSGNQIIPAGPGTAIVTVCNGSVSTTITVTVSM